MATWTDNTGFWEDGAQSWLLEDDEFYAHIRKEGENSYWWRVHNTESHTHVDSGTSWTFEWAQAHVADRIRWTREARSNA